MRRTFLMGAFTICLAIAGQMPLIGSAAGQQPASPAVKLKFRLEWVPQAQFAGYIVAQMLGYYRDVNLNVEILPAGPDLKPQVTVAAGTDDIAVGVPNQVITARSNGVPLKIVAQIFQGSANRYVLKKENTITSLTQLRGKPVGLWLGGDEVEFIAMLKTVNMTLSDVKVIPQEFSVIPFLQDKYVLSEVTVYNELNVIEREGFGPDKLQILSPADYGAAIQGDMIFTTEALLASRPNDVAKFLTASFRGWQYALKHPDDTVALLVKYNPELKAADQRAQLAAVLKLTFAGRAADHGIGYMEADTYGTAVKILLNSGQINSSIDPKTLFDSRPWASVPKSVTNVR